MEIKLFIGWFEDNSKWMDVETMSNQHFEDVPGDSPGRKGELHGPSGVSTQLLLVPPQKH